MRYGPGTAGQDTCAGQEGSPTGPSKWDEAHSCGPDSESHFMAVENNILKTKKFRDVTTVLNERKHLKIVFRSAQYSVILSLDRSDRLGLSALHCPFNFKLNGASTFLECSSHYLLRARSWPVS